MSDVVLHEPREFDLAQQMDYSKALASASIIPPDFRGSPANILVAIGYAQALGEHPIVALTDVYIVKGRPSMSASMMHRRAIEAGHRVRVVADDQQATASIWRRDDPSYEHKSVWTIERAKAAGIANSDTWKKFTSAMLRSRAISEVCRLACPEVLGAVKYLPDEIGGDFIDAPEAAPVKPAGPTTKVSRKRKAPEPAADTHGQEDLKAAIAETGEAPSEPAFKRMFAILSENGLSGREEALGYVSSVVGREITSRSELTAQEVARVSDSFTPTPEENNA